jgi:tRNA 2-thiocytidine biosynthesis protein TtcA
LCGSQENLQRQEIKRMMHQWERQYPGRTETMFTALQNLVPSHLMDTTRYNFKDIQTTGVADEAGDKVFDDEAFPPASLGKLPLVQL